MKSVAAPAALRERLGGPGADALTEMLDAHMRECIEFTLDKTAERYERRLVEEMSKTRVDMADMRRDLSEQIAASRFDVVKWNFAFWVGQLVAVAGVLGLLLRAR